METSQSLQPKKIEVKGILLSTFSKDMSTKKIEDFLATKKKTSFHIANLNADIFELATHDYDLKNILNRADLRILDGIGVEILLKIKSLPFGDRITGTDFMIHLCDYACKNKKKIFLLGGTHNVAEKTGERLEELFDGLQWQADEGFKDVKSITLEENKRVLSNILKYNPSFLFVAYGPPYQEKWIDSHRQDLPGVVCMGVGGAFNLISGYARRAPRPVQKIGLEWLWRFIFEPWRRSKFKNNVLFLKNFFS